VASCPHVGRIVGQRIAFDVNGILVIGCIFDEPMRLNFSHWH